eukprot:6469376-Amphidinium_carterae.1
MVRHEVGMLKVLKGAYGLIDRCRGCDAIRNGDVPHAEACRRRVASTDLEKCSACKTPRREGLQHEMQSYQKLLQ